MAVNIQFELLETRARGQATDSRSACLNAAHVASTEVEPLQAGKARDRSIDGGETLDAGVAGKQVGANAAHRWIAAHRHADGGPEIPHQQGREPPGRGRAKASPRLVKVECIVAPFVLDDSFKNSRKQRTLAVRAVMRKVGATNQRLVTGQRRDLIDSAEGHVYGGEMTRGARQECDAGANDAIGETGLAAQIDKALV